MRPELVMMVAFACAAPAIADADPAKAKVANTRGYALHKAKKYKEAAVEYRNAITEDPSYLIAHYNLACVASLTKDMETSIKELAWVADRATWDPAARSAAAKTRTDRDLEWIRNADAQGFILTGTDLANEGALDLTASPMPELAGNACSDARLVKAIASAPGRHDDKCSSAAFRAPLDREASGTVIATLHDGVALLDAGGKVLARSEPLGCTGPRDRITALNQAAGILKPHDYSDRVLMNTRMVVVQYWAGTRQSVTIFAIKDKKELVRAFDGVLGSSAGDGSLLQTPVLGNLVYTAPGEQKKRVFHWDGASSKYVEEK